MILSTYTQFRRFFSSLTNAPDGLPAWPGPLLPDGSFDNATPSSIRANSFSGTMVATSQGGYQFATTLIGPLVDAARIPDGDDFWPFTVTCNAEAADGSPPTHDYDFYLSQRRDVGRYPAPGTLDLVEWDSPPFSISIPHAGKSGTIAIDLTSAGARLLAGGSSVTAQAFRTLFMNTHLYCCRRSDGAIQWARVGG